MNKPTKDRAADQKRALRELLKRQSKETAKRLRQALRTRGIFGPTED